MAIGERIHFFRLLRGMTQKYLGTAVGFPERSADVRLAQYETGSRKPKADLTAALAQVLDVSPQALDVPDIDSQIGLMHTLFTLEDVLSIPGGFTPQFRKSETGVPMRRKPHFCFNGNLYSGTMETASSFLIMYVCVT